MVIEFTFGGFTTKKTVREAFLGYDDSFLKALKDGANP